MKTVLKAGSDTAGSVAEVFFMCNVSRQLSGTAFLSALSRAGPVRITPGARLFLCAMCLSAPLRPQSVKVFQDIFSAF